MAQGIKELAGQVWPLEFHPGNMHMHTHVQALKHTHMHKCANAVLSVEFQVYLGPATSVFLPIFSFVNKNVCPTIL